MLIDEKLYEDHLKKMRNPKMEPLKKTELAKALVKNCSTKASQKIVTCEKCGYLNGAISNCFLANIFRLDDAILKLIT